MEIPVQQHHAGYATPENGNLPDVQEPCYITVIKIYLEQISRPADSVGALRMRPPFWKMAASREKTDGHREARILWRDCDDPDSRLYLCVPRRYISCTASTGIGVSDRFSGVSDRSPYTSYKLTIRGATEDDAADYYCQQSVQYPLTQ
ncbi:unnamed protein product [Ranitomeya imitator]|uniref:Immunoglobulin V-set domain-containing protein n=1 Tax=Ranitomeya imitator TaxID=111125 RepID=A0ABN9LS91_9NEOB|nr:unnamed protein product [Ranitomeya imitator]